MNCRGTLHSGDNSGTGGHTSGSSTPEEEGLSTGLPNSAKSVPGLTRHIARGSLWSLGGQIATLTASLIATPFVIRLLGTEAYGVLILINLLIGYMGFADLGMGQASTKFGAAAHAHGDDAGEAAAIYTSLLVLSVPSLMVASIMAFAADPIVDQVLRLPTHLRNEAILAMRLAAVGFAARGVAGVLNTPQLVRLRMDLYTAITAGSAVIQICFVLVALSLGGRLVAAIVVISGVNIGTALATAAVSWRLLPCLPKPRLRLHLVRPLLRFGGATAVMTLAGLILMDGEKLMVVRFASVRELAHYSVAFTLARLLALLPAALGQPLLPAFARLHAALQRESLETLYTRALHGLLLWMVPAALLLCVGTRAVISLWAGSDYERESLLPFYILTMGCIFDGMSYIPRILLSAVGRPDLIARYHLVNLIPYVLVGAGLISRFGAAGAATAWSLRAATESILIFLTAWRTIGFSAFTLPASRRSYGITLAALVLPVLLVGSVWPSTAAMTSVSIASLALYSTLIWVLVLTRAERTWFHRILRPNWYMPRCERTRQEPRR
jgi:O-antigen/teichoic acid export membrane protein